MNARTFHNAVRILLSTDPDELRAAGVIDENWGTPQASDRDQVRAFCTDPFREALRMPDANFERLVVLIESRQPRREDDITRAPDGTGPISEHLSDPHEIAHAVISAIKSRDEIITRVAQAARRADEAIDKLHKAFGAPGDYGYSTPKGDALYRLLLAQVELHSARTTDEVDP